VRYLGLLSKYLITSRLKKRKRSEIYLDYITSSNKARYIKQEERAVKRNIGDDLDYKNILIRSSLLD
jgi:hypothetical protein